MFPYLAKVLTNSMLYFGGRIFGKLTFDRLYHSTVCCVLSGDKTFL